MSFIFCHSPSIFAQLRSNLFAFAAQANPNAGCKCQIGESRKCKTGLPVSPRVRVGMGFERDKRAAAGNDKEKIFETLLSKIHSNLPIEKSSKVQRSQNPCARRVSGAQI